MIKTRATQDKHKPYTKSWRLRITNLDSPKKAILMLIIMIMITILKLLFATWNPLSQRIAIFLASMWSRPLTLKILASKTTKGLARRKMLRFKNCRKSRNYPNKIKRSFVKPNLLRQCWWKTLSLPQISTATHSIISHCIWRIILGRLKAERLMIWRNKPFIWEIWYTE